MKIAEFSIKNSLLVNLLSLFVIAFGVFALRHLNREVFPAVDFDIVTVSTAYPGASAEDVEKFVTIPIEKELRGVSGIDEMDSTSDEGLSFIGITLEPDLPDKDRVVRDIKDAVDRVGDLPEGVTEDPVVFELKAKERPALEVSVSGDRPERVLRRYAEALEDRILDIKGVASVRRLGWRDREFWVEVFPGKMRALHVSLEELTRALKQRNVTIPGGRLTTPDQEYDIRVTGEFTSTEEIAEAVIRANDAGRWVRVKDVARVIDTFEDETHIAKVDGRRALGMVVVKSEKGDVIDVAGRVKALVADFRRTLPEGMEATITNDYSYYVKRRLGVLQTNGAIGFVLVLVMLFLFLDPVPALVTALGVPVAFLITATAMLVLGVHVNIVSMLGLIIVLGMLVDDGIIIAENVHRYVEEGVPPKEAAVRGASEVILPVTVTILTTCAAFLPLLFMHDIIGKFIREIPLVVMIALAASMAEAFVILPSHLSDLLSWRHGRVGRRIGVKRWWRSFSDRYVRALTFVLDRRRLVVFGLLVPLLFLSVYIWMFHMKKILFTDEGVEQFKIRAEAPKGTPLEKMNTLIAPVEDLVAGLPPEELRAFRTYIGSIENEMGFDPNARRGTHLAQITVFLTPFQDRKRSTREIAESLRTHFKEIPGFEKLYVFRPRPGPPVGRAVDVAVKGDRFAVLEEAAEAIARRLRRIPGVTDIETSHETGKRQLAVVVDEEKARTYGLTVGGIAAAVRAAFKGGVATTVRPVKAEEEIRVRVRFAREARDDPAAFDEILVANAAGRLVPLSAVARIEPREGLYRINHLDGKRVIHVLADVDGKRTTSQEVNTVVHRAFGDVFRGRAGYTITYGGEFEKQQEATQGLVTAFLFALFLIFIILTAMFQSLVQPFVVMMAIPFGLIGVVLAFLAHGRPLGFFGFMGIVGLTGIVVNDSIVLVDFINRLRKGGRDRRTSLIEAGRLRLRPVLMTTLTTIGGLVSVAYGIGGGDPFLKPLALAILWGLVFATGLTLLVIPCIYAIIDDLALWVRRRSGGLRSAR